MKVEASNWDNTGVAGGSGVGPGDEDFDDDEEEEEEDAMTVPMSTPLPEGKPFSSSSISVMDEDPFSTNVLPGGRLLHVMKMLEVFITDRHLFLNVCIYTMRTEERRIIYLLFFIIFCDTNIIMLLLSQLTTAHPNLLINIRYCINFPCLRRYEEFKD